MIIFYLIIDYLIIVSNLSMSLSKKLAIDNIPQLIKGKRILMRVDFNVPMKEGMISDTKRIVSTLPTINYVLENGA